MTSAFWHYVWTPVRLTLTGLVVAAAVLMVLLAVLIVRMLNYGQGDYHLLMVDRALSAAGRARRL